MIEIIKLYLSLVIGLYFIAMIGYGVIVFSLAIFSYISALKEEKLAERE